jgi:hypothetical protein
MNASFGIIYSTLENNETEIIKDYAELLSDSFG